MARARPRLGALTTLLCALAGLAACRELAKVPPAAVAGTAAILSIDEPGKPPRRVLTVHTPGGRRVVVDTQDVEDALPPGLRSGDAVRVDGAWYPGARGRGRGAGAGEDAADSSLPPGLQPLDECLYGNDCVRARAVTRSGGRARRGGRPVVTDTPGVDPDSPPEVAAEGASVTGATIAIPLLQLDVNTLFIPIAGVTAACAAPGATCFTNCPGISGQQPPMSRAAVRGKIFAELNAGATVGAYFNKCSYGRTRLNVNNSNVTEVVKLPCVGTVYDNTYNFTSCSFENFNGWADAADEVLRAQGVPVDSYKYRVYMTPPGLCPWAGLAYVGCPDTGFYCRAWIGGGFWGTPQAIAHELGHNLYMEHANKLFAQTGTPAVYADSTSTMGHCCFDRCLNTVQAWQQGWLTLRQLTDDDLPLNTPRSYFIYSQSLYSYAGLRIDLSHLGLGTQAIFVGYRQAKNFDAWMLGILGTDGTKLDDMVHLYTSGIYGNEDVQETAWRAALAVNQTWTLVSAGITVTRIPTSSSIGCTVQVTRTK